MKNVKKFYYPETLEEALSLLRDESEKKMIIAGGSSVSLLNDPKVEALVDITRMGLDFIKEEMGYLVIGATTNIQEIYQSEEAGKLADGMLKNAALNVASRPLRNAITMGGNIVHLKAWSDMPTILLTLDASVKLQGEKEEIIPAIDFFREHPSKMVGHKSIVTQVLFPKTMEKSGGEYIKFSKTKGDYAIVTVGCYLEFEEGECSLARIAVGSASKLPGRCKEAEKQLEGKRVNESMLEKAAAICKDKVVTIGNIWGSAQYKSELIEALMRRALRSAYHKAMAKN